MDEDSVPPDVEAEVAGAVRTALAKHGYERLTTKKIAAESEKSEAGLYYHYDSKDEMIAVFLDAAADHLGADLEEGGATDPEAQLRAAMDHLFVDPEDEDARGLNIAVMELLSHAPYNETLRAPLRAMVRTTQDHLAEIIADGIEAGVFREVDPQGTAALLNAAADGSTGFYLALRMDDAGESLYDQVSAYVDWLVVDESS